MITLLSWGSHDFTPLPQGLRFKVDGFKHQGFVSVIYQEGTDDYTIQLLDNDMVITKEFDGIYSDNLIRSIDMEIEKTDDYEDRIQNTYKQ